MEARIHSGPGLHALRWLNRYRVVVAGSLYVLVLGGENLQILGVYAPELFRWTAAAYLAFAVISSFTIHFARPAPAVQLHMQLAVDIAAITLLVYASGGVRSGLGGLLFVPVAGGSLLASRRTAILYAALATLAILGTEVYAQLSGAVESGAYTQGGILGMILFTTAVLGHLLAQRARESEALAEQRGVDLANMAQLNDYIIQHLETGIVAVDGDDRVRMMNETAAGFLGADRERSYQRPLAEISPQLQQCLRDWRERPWDEPPSLPGHDPDMVLIPHLMRLESRPGSGALVFLEDARIAAERMQSLKLAALGRLTASIAHEIRNPLGAVSHAGQLLGETERLDDESRRLTEIIREHTGRVNTIIENVLQLSRREQTRPESFDLHAWLYAFAEEFRDTQQLEDDAVTVTHCPEGISIRMDPSHLHQVLWNLCENALTHATTEGSPSVELRAGEYSGERAYLEVLDRGPGVPADAEDQIFEPFYSAAAHGTGLGLFIARELCECNRARLTYQPRVEGGSCFRISFADAKRWVT